MLGFSAVSLMISGERDSGPDWIRRHHVVPTGYRALKVPVTEAWTIALEYTRGCNAIEDARGVHGILLGVFRSRSFLHQGATAFGHIEVMGRSVFALRVVPDTLPDESSIHGLDSILPCAGQVHVNKRYPSNPDMVLVRET